MTTSTWNEVALVFCECQHEQIIFKKEKISSKSNVGFSPSRYKFYIAVERKQTGKFVLIEKFIETNEV